MFIMHPALRQGPLFTKNTPFFHFFTPPFFTFFTKKTTPPPFHFLPTSADVCTRGEMTSQNLWSRITTRSPFSGYNSAYCVELKSEDLWSYSRKIESVSWRKCPSIRLLGYNKAYLSDAAVTHIS